MRGGQAFLDHRLQDAEHRVGRYERLTFLDVLGVGRRLLGERCRQLCCHFLDTGSRLLVQRNCLRRLLQLLEDNLRLGE